MLVHPGRGAEYCSTVEYFRLGSKAFLYSLVGLDFYKAMRKNGARLMKQRKVREVVAVVKREQAAVVERAMRDAPNLITSIGEDDEINGMKVKWISILLV